ncbi:MAG: type II toxin-antitoxin system VapC family toxin [Spirochaetales bacterium]|nr:type II toxin-antitoxin system VapC family toxin [Spirochaetales bacterium]
MIGVDTTWLIDLEIPDSPRHKGAVQLFEQWKKKHSSLAIFYLSFLEFQHLVSDDRRFNSPLTMAQAVDRSWYWIDNDRIKVIYPTETAFKRAQLWMAMYRLGRKRIYDTQLAAAFAEAGVTEIYTANPSDFEIFEAFDLVDYQ